MSKTIITNLITGEIIIKEGKNWKSEETKRRHHESFKGKHHSEEARRKMKEYRAKQIFTEESKKKNSESHKGNKSWTGRKHTIEEKIKMSNARKGKINGENNPMFGKHHSEETKEKIRKETRLAMINQKCPYQDTSIELDVQDALIKQNIPFEPHKIIPGLLSPPYQYHKWDDVIESLKVLIEVQGCWWHGCPIHFPNMKDKRILGNMKRDSIIIPEARSKGWKVIEIWEHTIKESEIKFELKKITMSPQK